MKIMKKEEELILTPRKLKIIKLLSIVEKQTKDPQTLHKL